MQVTGTGITGAELLARVRLSESERRTAQQYLEQGERVAECILRVIAVVSSALHAAERALRTIGIRSAS